MIRTYLNHLPKNFLAFPVVPAQTDWDTVPAPLLEVLQREANYAAESEISRLYLTDWLEFFRTGARHPYELKCFQRRKQLRDLAYGMLFFDEAPFRDVLMNLITAICEETAWQLPANNFYIAGTPALQWPDTQRPVIDLPAAQTGALLACCHHALANVLVPPVRARMMCEVEQRLIVPYLEEHFWWMASKQEAACAWTTQVTHAVLLCAFAMPFSYEIRRKVMRQAVYSLDYFLQCYTAEAERKEEMDGEHEALMAFFRCLEILSFTASDPFEKIWKEPKVLAMARRLSQGTPSVEDPVECAQEFSLAQRLCDNTWALAAAQRWQHHLQKGTGAAGIDLQAALVQAKYAAAMQECASAAVQEEPPMCCGEWDLRVRLKQQSDDAAVLGSVALFYEQNPLLIELGDGSYAQTTPSGKQFTILTQQSQWHNLPTFNGVMQSALQEDRLQLNREQTQEQLTISMNLSDGWGGGASLQTFVRNLSLTESGLVIRDECAGGYSFAFSSLMLAQRPILHETYAELGDIVIAWEGLTAPAEVDELCVLDEAHLKQWGNAVYRLRLPFASVLEVRVQRAARVQRAPWVQRAPQPSVKQVVPFQFEQIGKST